MRIRKPLVLHIRGAEKEALVALEEVSLPADWPIHRLFKISFIFNLKKNVIGIAGMIPGRCARSG